jgi:hypothetical protein
VSPRSSRIVPDNEPAGADSSPVEGSAEPRSRDATASDRAAAEPVTHPPDGGQEGADQHPLSDPEAHTGPPRAALGGDPGAHWDVEAIPRTLGGPN